jgi:hypothetical protein
MKYVIAAVFAVLIFWVIKPSNSPVHINNSQPSAVKATQVDKATVKPAMQRTEAKPVQADVTGEVVQAVKPVPQPTEPKDIAEAKAKDYGWTGDQWQALEQLWHKESGWNPNAYNASSGACGIPQAVPCTKIPNPSDVSSQLDWGMTYIKSRYGTPSKALAFWQSRTPIDGRDVGNWY